MSEPTDEQLAAADHALDIIGAPFGQDIRALLRKRGTPILAIILHEREAGRGE